MCSSILHKSSYSYLSECVKRSKIKSRTIIIVTAFIGHEYIYFRTTLNINHNLYWPLFFNIVK